MNMPTTRPATETLITPDRHQKTLTIERRFNAPRELVFRVFTEAEHLRHWFSPAPWTLAVCNVDLRVGGEWQYKMQGPDGESAWGKAIYHEITPPERLVYTDAFTDADGVIDEAMPKLHITVVFTEQDGKTTVTSVSKLASAEEIDTLMEMGMAQGVIQTWNGLDTYLDTLVHAEASEPAGNTTMSADPGSHEIVLTRIFNAPRDLVFRVYTDPTTIAQWWGPAALETTVDQMDVKPGGLWRYVQRDADGSEYAFHGVYHAVTPSEQLVYTFEFEGMPGHVVLETVTFEDHDGKTRMIDQSVFQSLEARDGMLASGMEAGSRELMDRLAAIVEQG